MRWRLIAVFMATTLVVLAAHDIPLARYLRTVERDRIVTALERDAFTIGGRAEEALEDRAAPGDPALQTLVDEYRADNGARVLITDDVGTAIVISDEESRAGVDYSSRPEIASALTGEPTSGVRHSSTLDQDLLYVAVPVFSGERVEGTVRLTYPASVVTERVEKRVSGLAFVALISLAAAALAALVMAGTVARPLRRLRHVTYQAARGDLSVRAPTDEGPPEVRDLAAAFNTMSEQISVLLDQQRAFTGDASHQLRTPLTALRLRLEQASELVDTDPEEARLRVEAASAEVERMQRLVEGLLTLARAEGRRQELVDVDAAEIARERSEIWKPLAEEGGVRVVVSAPATALTRAAPGALEQMVDNYIDNALSVSPPGSAITVDVSVSPTFVTVRVLDEGPGMSDEQLAHAFDRFWRAPDAAAGGSGLGLAIVMQLAKASGGSVVVSRRAGGGLIASVALSRSSEKP